MLQRALRLVAALAVVGAAVAAVPAAAIAGGGCHAGDGSVHTDGATTVVRMDLCSFAPTIARIPAGTEVRFLNTSTLVHALAGERMTWGSAVELQPGQDVRQRFDAPGTYPFSCPLHPGMVGAVVVEDAAADDAGTADDAAPIAAITTGTPGGGIAAVPGLLAGSLVLAGMVVGLSLGWLAARRRRVGRGAS